MINDNTSDEQIVASVLNGEIESYRVIVERYQKHIFSIGMRFFKNEDDSYDFVQEVFIRAFNSLHTFKGHSRFRFWLVRVAYNFGINEIKGAVSEQEIIEQTLLEKEHVPEKLHLRSEIRDALMQAIGGLPERYRICMDLYFFMGLSYDEISRITDYPVNTIKSNVYRSKHILRESLSGTVAEEYHDM